MLFFKKKFSRHKYRLGLRQWCPELSPELAQSVQWLRPAEKTPPGETASRFSNTPGAHKWHHYFKIYDELFGALRLRPISVLEIGIYKGASARVWRDFFHAESTIVGIDINTKCAEFDAPGKKLHIRIGSQQDKEFLTRVNQEFGPFDLIIDDGSHVSSHMISSFNHLFLDGLKPGGLYFVEDTHTSFWESHRDQDRSFMDFCFGLVQCMHAHYVANTTEKLFRVEGPDSIASTAVPRITTLIDEIRFLDSVIAIRKASSKSLPQSQHW